MKLTMCQDRLQSADQARQVEIRVYQTCHCCLGSVLVSVWMCYLTGHQLSDPRGACASPRGTLQREPPSLASPGPPNRHLYFPQPLTRVLQVVTVEETGHVLRRAQGAEQQAQQSLKQRAVAMFLAGTGRYEAAAREAPLPTHCEQEPGVADDGKWEPVEAWGTVGGMAKLARLEETVTTNAAKLLTEARRLAPPPPRQLRVPGPPPPGS